MLNSFFDNMVMSRNNIEISHLNGLRKGKLASTHEPVKVFQKKKVG